MDIRFSDEVRDAIDSDKPIVALESTVIAHGLPRPDNIETAHKLESIVRQSGAVPATIAMFSGQLYAGLTDRQIHHLANTDGIRKISRRDLAIATARQLDGATTVSTTVYTALRAGIQVFATGGIGGVHRGFSADVSADLTELARSPITVVCSGAKIVLDLPATREWLETYGVTVLGWQCSDMPAFYSRSSGLAVDERIDTVEEAVRIIKARNEMRLGNAILVTVPVPGDDEISINIVESWLNDALTEARENNVAGKETTPYLLSAMSKLSKGATLTANIALLENNARVAAQIACGLHGH